MLAADGSTGITDEFEKGLDSIEATALCHSCVVVVVVVGGAASAVGGFNSDIAAAAAADFTARATG